jgi:DNA invertase Pin-like site-specific DNA recombinase
MRVLGRLRLSRATEESAGSTSIERQREAVEKWAEMNSHQIVGWAVDDGVSGGVDPFKTAGLGPWLRDRLGEWDILCAWRLDRLGRNAIALNSLFGFCLEHNRSVVSVTESIDLSSWSGRMVAGVLAGVAEGEREGTRERVRSSREKLRRESRWPGGRPPYGYKQARNRGGDGWVLVVDEKAAAVVRRIVTDVLAGKPLNAVATDLNSEKVLAPSEHYRQQTGKPVGGSKWRQAPMKLMLRSKALLGYVHYKNEVIRDDAGAPIRMAPELITLDEYNRVQAVLDGVESRYSGRGNREVSPLSGLVFCFFCEAGLTFTENTVHGRKYGYYRHPVNSECEITGLLPLDVLQENVEQAFLTVLEDEPVRERVWQPGDSREADLQDAVQAFDDLSATAGTLRSKTARARLQGQLAALDERIAQLEAAPRIEGGMVWVEVGGTYGDAWADADTDGRRELLRRSGITVSAAVQREGRRSKFNDGAWFVRVNIPEGLMPAGRQAELDALAAVERRRVGIE